MFPISRLTAPPCVPASLASGTYSMAPMTMYNTTIARETQYASACGTRTAVSASIAQHNTTFARPSLPNRTTQRAPSPKRRSRSVSVCGQRRQSTGSAPLRESHSRALSRPAMSRLSHLPKRLFLPEFPLRITCPFVAPPHPFVASASPRLSVIPDPAMQQKVESHPNTAVDTVVAEKDRPVATYAFGEVAGEGGHEASSDTHLRDEETATQKEVAQALSEAGGVVVEARPVSGSPLYHNDGGEQSGSSLSLIEPPSPLARDSSHDVRAASSICKLESSLHSSTQSCRARLFTRKSMFLPFGLPSTSRDVFLESASATPPACVTGGPPAERSPQACHTPSTARFLPPYDFPRSAMALECNPTQREETESYNSNLGSTGTPCSPCLSPSSLHCRNARAFRHLHSRPEADPSSAGGQAHNDKVPLTQSLMLSPSSPENNACHFNRQRSAPRTHLPPYREDSVHSTLQGSARWVQRYDGLRDPPCSRRPGRPSQPAPTLLHRLHVHGPHGDPRHSRSTKRTRSVALPKSHEDSTAVQHGANAKWSQSASLSDSAFSSNGCQSQAVDGPSHGTLNFAESSVWSSPWPAKGSFTVGTSPFARTSDMAFPAAQSVELLSHAAETELAHASSLSRFPESRPAEQSRNTLANVSLSPDPAPRIILHDSMSDAAAIQTRVSPPLLPDLSSPITQGPSRESASDRSNSSTLATPTAKQGSIYQAADQRRVSSPWPPASLSPHSKRRSDNVGIATHQSMSPPVRLCPSYHQDALHESLSSRSISPSFVPRIAEQGSTRDPAANQPRVPSPWPPGPSSPRTWRRSSFDMPSTQPSVSVTIAFAPSSPPSLPSLLPDCAEFGASFRGSRPSCRSALQGSTCETPSAQPNSISLTVTPSHSVPPAWQSSMYDPSTSQPGTPRRGSSFLAIHDPPRGPPSTPSGLAFSFVPAHVPLITRENPTHDPSVSQPTTSFALTPDLPPPSLSPVPPYTSADARAAKDSPSSPAAATHLGFDNDAPIASAPASSSRTADPLFPTTRSIIAQSTVTCDVDTLDSQSNEGSALDDDNVSSSETSSDSTDTASSASSIRSERWPVTRAHAHPWPSVWGDKDGGAQVGCAEVPAFIRRVHAESELESSSYVTSVDTTRFSSHSEALLEVDRMRMEIEHQEHKMARQHQRLLDLRRYSVSLMQ